jgi:hypothetical protein
MFTDDRLTIKNESGYALMTTMIFVFVLVISGLAFFVLAARESSGAIYREESSEAFYLADGAIERARAKFLDDRSWRTGWTDEDAGRGEYDLTVTDSTYLGESNVVHLLAAGRVRRAERKIEVFAKVPPSGFGLGILIRGDADVNGNFCLLGEAHVVGNPDFGPGNVHLSCGTYTSGFDITPPPVYTEPEYYPGSTYYYVVGNRIGPKYQARIFNAAGLDITTALGDSLHQDDTHHITSYHAGRQAFIYSFDDPAALTHYFDGTTGIFSMAPGDSAVVVNFGQPPMVNPPGVNGTAELEFDGDAASMIHATILNARFTGATLEQRVDPAYWTGGVTTLKQITFEPYLGIAILSASFQKVGGSHTQVGTTEWPALVYVTNDVEDMNSNYSMVGAITCLGDWNSTGGPNIEFDAGFLEHLPGYLVDNWDTGVSGTLEVLNWREVAASGP